MKVKKQKKKIYDKGIMHYASYFFSQDHTLQSIIIKEYLVINLG